MYRGAVPSSNRIPVVAGVDIGTTNLKVVALDADGTVVSRAIQPTPREAGTLLIDAAALVASIEDMVAAVCGDQHALTAVATAGVGEDGVLLGPDLVPVTPALAWFDPIRHELFAQLAPDLDADAGIDVVTDPTRALAGWLWARGHPGFVADGVWVALADAPAVLWAHRPFLSDTLASRTGAWRSRDRSWSATRVEASLGSTRLLPPVVRTGEVIGPVVSPSLRASGVLAPDAIVVAGGHDHPVGAWGVDRMVPGVVLDSMGTAEVIVTQTGRARTMLGAEVDAAPGIRSEGTTVLRVEELARNVQWASRDREVAHHLREVLSGHERVLPVLDSGYFVPGRRGGGVPAFAPEAPADPRVRASAVLGALAIAGRDAVAAVRAASGSVGELRFAGGWLRSPGWIDVKAEIDGMRATPILEPEVTAVGAALLAAAARGWSADPARALSGFTSMLH